MAICLFLLLNLAFTGGGTSSANSFLGCWGLPDGNCLPSWLWQLPDSIMLQVTVLQEVTHPITTKVVDPPDPSTLSFVYLSCSLPCQFPFFIWISDCFLPLYIIFLYLPELKAKMFNICSDYVSVWFVLLFQEVQVRGERIFCKTPASASLSPWSNPGFLPLHWRLYTWRSFSGAVWSQFLE